MACSPKLAGDSKKRHGYFLRNTSSSLVFSQGTIPSSNFKHRALSTSPQFPYSTCTMCVPVKLLHSTVRSRLSHIHDLKLPPTDGFLRPPILTLAQASGVAMSVALYYILLFAAASAFVQQVLRLPFASGSVATHLFRTCSHLALCLLVCASCWLSIAKFHASMVIDGTWREDGCSNENNGLLGVEFVLHLCSVLLYFCMSNSNWLPSRGAESGIHDHDE